MLYRSALAWISLIQSVVYASYGDSTLYDGIKGLRNSTTVAYSSLTQSLNGDSFTGIVSSSNSRSYGTESSRDFPNPSTTSLSSSASSSTISSTSWGTTSGSTSWDSNIQDSGSYSSVASVISSWSSSSSPFRSWSPSSTFSTSSSVSGSTFSASNSALSSSSTWSDFPESRTSTSYGSSWRPISTASSSSDRNFGSSSPSSYPSLSSAPISTSSLSSISRVVMFDDTLFSAGSSSGYSSTTSSDSTWSTVISSSPSSSASSSYSSVSSSYSSPSSGPSSSYSFVSPRYSSPSSGPSSSYSFVSPRYSTSVTLSPTSSTGIPSRSDSSKSPSSSNSEYILTTSYSPTSTTSSSPIKTFTSIASKETSESIEYSIVVLTTRGNEYTATTVVTDSPTAGSQKSAKYANEGYWESPGKIAGTFVPVGLVCLLIVLFLIWAMFLHPRKKQKKFDTFYSSNLYSPSSTNSSPSILQSKHSSFSGLAYADEKGIVNPRTLSEQPSLENPFELPRPVIVDQRLDFHEMLNNFDNSSSKVSLADDVDYSRKVLHVGNK